MPLHLPYTIPKTAPLHSPYTFNPYTFNPGTPVLSPYICSAPLSPQNNSVGVGYEAKMSLHYRTPDPLDPVRMQFSLENTMQTVAHPNDTAKVRL